MTGIRSLLSSAANRVADTASSLADTAQSVADTAKSVANKATDVAEGLKTKPSSAGLEQDTWDMDVAAAGGPGFYEKAIGLAKTVKAGAEEIRDAVVGEAKSRAGEKLSEIAEWLQPSVSTLNEVKEIRQEVQQRVEDELAKFPVQELREAIVNTGEELVPQILQTTADVLDIPFKFTTTYTDIRNRVLNQVGEAAASVVLSQEETILTAAGGLKEIAQLMADPASLAPEDSVIAKALLNAIVPRQNLHYTLSVWMVDTIGNTIESSIDVAKHIQNTEGLPTRGNFDKWLGEIDPGATRVFNGEVTIDLAPGKGGKASLGLGNSIYRSPENPNVFTLELSSEAATALKLGVSLPGKKLSIDGGAGVVGKSQFTFDIRDPEQLELFCDVILAHQSGIPLGRRSVNALKYLTGATVEQGISAGGDVRLGLKFDANVAITRIDNFLRADDGEIITRNGFNIRGELSKGKPLLGTVPPDTITKLLSSDAVDNSELAAKILDAVTGGQLGNRIAGGLEFEVGTISQNAALDHFYGHIKLDGQIFGHEGELEVQLTLHNPGELAKRMGMSSQMLAAQIATGKIEFGTLLQTLAAQGQNLHDYVGIKVSHTTTTRQGLDANFEIFELRDQMVRTDTVELFSFGRLATLDNNRESITEDRQDAELRQLDRPIHC